MEEVLRDLERRVRDHLKRIGRQSNCLPRFLEHNALPAGQTLESFTRLVEATNRAAATGRTLDYRIPTAAR